MTPHDFDSELEHLARHPRPEYGVNEAWERLRAATVALDAAERRASEQVGVAVATGSVESRKRRHRSAARSVSWLRASATVVAVLGLSILAFVYARPRTGPGVTRTYATRAGELARVTLTDGTQLTIAPRTTVRLVDFGSRARTIDIDGLANFVVPSNSTTPFLVRTGRVTARVLGTTFFVRHYHDDPDVRVFVTSGKVLVASTFGDGERSAVVTAGQAGDVRDSTPLVRTVEHADMETGWLDNQLVFRDTPVNKVLETLTRWYGYQFRIVDSAMLAQRVTVGLSTQSSAKALATLTQILGARVTVMGDTVTLTPQHARPASGTQPAKGYDVWTPSREVGR